MNRVGTDLDRHVVPLDGRRSPTTAAKWAFWWAVVFVAMHVYWELGGTVGFGDAAEPTPDGPATVSGWIFNVVIVTMFAVGVAAPLALFRGPGAPVSHVDWSSR